MRRLPPIFMRTVTLFPYTTRFRSCGIGCPGELLGARLQRRRHLGGAVDHQVGGGAQLRALALHGLVDLGRAARRLIGGAAEQRSEEHTSELQSLMRISYAVLFLQKKMKLTNHRHYQIDCIWN